MTFIDPWGNEFLLKEFTYSLQRMIFLPVDRGLVDEFLQRNPAVSTDPPQPCHLYTVPALCFSEGRLPGK